MNMDHWLIILGTATGCLGFLIGYAKGHEHGKIQGRIALRREQKQLVR